MPPPPPIGWAPPQRGGLDGWGSAGERRVSRPQLYTSALPPSYPRKRDPSYPRPAAGISLGSASKPLPRRHPAPARPRPRRHSCAGRNPRSRPRLLLALEVLRRRGSGLGRAVGRQRRIRALVVAWVPACAGMTGRGAGMTGDGRGLGRGGRCLGAGGGEIPAASAGMTEKASTGMTEKASAGMTELFCAGVTELGMRAAKSYGV